MSTKQDFFRVCSICRTPIAYGADYYSCSVSTCNRKATALYFCSVPCWDAHVPDARHKDAWAEKQNAPRQADDVSGSADRVSTAVRRIVLGATPPAQGLSGKPGAPEGESLSSDEVLIVVSKLKSFIKEQSTMSTSDGVLQVLSDYLRALSVRAIKSAAQNSRKTVMARDFEAVLRGEVAKD